MNFMEKPGLVYKCACVTSTQTVANKSYYVRQCRCRHFIERHLSSRHLTAFTNALPRIAPSIWAIQYMKARSRDIFLATSRPNVTAGLRCLHTHAPPSFSRLSSPLLPQKKKTCSRLHSLNFQKWTLHNVRKNDGKGIKGKSHPPLKVAALYTCARLSKTSESSHESVLSFWISLR